MSKLFIAEDDPLMSRMYERAFKFGGHEVTLVHDGEAAFNALLEMNPAPEVALLDVMMPKMSGFDLLRKMKADMKLKSIPVVLLTNLAGRQDAEKGLQLGAALYLVKSEHNPKQVVEKIEALIVESASRSTAPRLATGPETGGEKGPSV